MRDFDRRWEQMQRSHNRIAAFAKFIIGFAFVAIVGIWLLYGYVAYTVVSDPEGVAKTIGGTIGEAVKSFNEKVQ